MPHHELKQLQNRIGEGAHLSVPEVELAVAALTDESVTPDSKADFLTALAKRGETPAEIAAFVSSLRERAIRPPIPDELRKAGLLDVCGTGGDRLGTFNISTTVSILAAAAGVKVVKHGNRAITSQVGSTDVLEALGIKVDLTPERAVDSLREQNFVFLFAQKYHPAFKAIGPARKLCAERGQRTLFNFLGPLLNPTRPEFQLLGVSRSDLCEPLALVLQKLGSARAMVVNGTVQLPEGPASLDEFSTLGPTTVAEFYQDRGFTVANFDPTLFPLQPHTLADLAGGNREESAAIVKAILEGKDRGPRRDAVLLNAGAALFVANQAKSIAEGWELAAETIDSGNAEKKLRALASFA